jgi:predicted nucleic acid-binding protein
MLNREEGKGFEAVRDIFYHAEAGKISVYMSIVNLVEVYYGYIQRYGVIETADAVMRNVGALPLKVITTVSEAVYHETARFKARYSMSLADAFLCGTAKSLSATIVTKDHEIEAAERGEALSVLWIN